MFNTNNQLIQTIEATSKTVLLPIQVFNLNLNSSFPFNSIQMSTSIFDKIGSPVQFINL